MTLKDACVVDEEGTSTYLGILEVRKYRRGRYLVKFKGLKWRNKVEGLKDLFLAVKHTADFVDVKTADTVTALAK